MDYCYFCMSALQGGSVCPVCGRRNSEATFLPHQLPPGTVLCGRYLLGKVLGKGAFGITYIALDLHLGTRIAVKEYYPSICSSRMSTVSYHVTIDESMPYYAYDGKAKFLQEAKVLAEFRSTPGIVDVYDYFEENGTAYIVMEYLEGQTLKEALQYQTFAPDDLFALMEPVMDALSLVHSRNLIHRDISPDNIMLTPKHQLVLMDFGAAREYSLSNPGSMTIMVKQGYAPEEQYRLHGDTGPWTDVYALCATMYHCLTGVLPQSSNERIMSDELLPPSYFGVKLTKAQEAALKRGMAVSAKKRFQTMDELKAALNRKGLHIPADFSRGDSNIPAPLADQPEVQESPAPASDYGMAGEHTGSDTPYYNMYPEEPAYEAGSDYTPEESVPQERSGILKYWPFAAGAAGLLVLILLIVLLVNAATPKRSGKSSAGSRAATAPAVMQDNQTEAPAAVSAAPDEDPADSDSSLEAAETSHAPSASSGSSHIVQNYTPSSHSSPSMGSPVICSGSSWSDGLDISRVETVTFQNTLSGAPDDAVDISKNGDGSVLRWGETDVTIAGNGTVIGGRDMSQMFYDFTSLESVYFGGCFDTSSVTDMAAMFCDCSSLTSLDLSGFDTSSVTDMSSMFAGCYFLTSLDVSGFDTSSVTDMWCMFDSCSSLTSLDVSGFDTSSVTDMTDMFGWCSSLTSLDVSGFDTSRVTCMYAMFNECSSLTFLDVSGFDTSSVTDMGWMFANCHSLTSLDVSGFDTSSVTDMSYMFYECSSLTGLDISGFVIGPDTDCDEMYDGVPGYS